MNKVILIGGLGRDPELRYTQSQTPVANFSIATDHWNSKTKMNESVWHNCTIWGKGAEHFSKYAKKGTKVAVEGEIKYEKFTDKEGVEKQKTIINCYLSPKLISDYRKKDEVSESDSASESRSGDQWNTDIDDIPF